MVKLYTVFFFLSLAFNVTSQPVIAYQTVVAGMVNPVDVVNAGDGSGKLYIAQQNGLVRSWNGTTLSNFINLNSIITTPTGGEQGLLSIAFHPDYETNGYFFVLYTNAAGDITLGRFRRDAVDPTIGDPSSGVVLLAIPKPGTPYFTNHNGGKINFGADGMLYFGTGDGGSGGDPFNNAQNLTSLLGKMLRLDVSTFPGTAPYYTIPSDNPFAATGGGVRGEIWAYGLRNPWRWSFDRSTNDMWIGDVGQGQWEEVNRVASTASGINYGWDCHEGNHNYTPAGCSVAYNAAVFEYGHDNATGGFSITGGYVYRGSEFASLVGKYVTADYVSGNLWILTPAGAGYTSTLQTGLSGSVASFGEAEDGTLYAVRRLSSNAPLVKIVVTSVVPVRLNNFNAVYKNNYTEITWTTSTEQDLNEFIVQYSDDNNHFYDAGRVRASGNVNGSNYSFRHNLPLYSRRFYRIAVPERNGSISYSEIKSVRTSSQGVQILSAIISSGGQLQLSIGEKINGYRIFNTSGAVIANGSLKNMSGLISVSLPSLPSGVYFTRFYSDNDVQSGKFMITK